MYFSSQTQTLSVETLALPSEMVAESVVNNIQTGGARDHSVGDDELILQLVIALCLGESTVSFLSLAPYIITLHYKSERIREDLSWSFDVDFCAAGCSLVMAVLGLVCYLRSRQSQSGHLHFPGPPPPQVLSARHRNNSNSLTQIQVNIYLYL